MTILVAYQNLPPVLMHKEEGEEVSRFFLHDRAQPFIVSLFQCVIVFKKICKWLRGRISSKRHRKSEFSVVLRKSNQWTAYTKSMGRIIKVEDPNKNVNGTLTMSALLPSTSEYTSKGQKVKAPAPFVKVSRKKRVTDALIREVDNRVRDYDRSLQQGRGNLRVEQLKQTLSDMENGESPYALNKTYRVKRCISQYDANMIIHKNEQLKEYVQKLDEEKRAEDINVFQVKEKKQQQPVEQSNDYRGCVYYGATIAIQAQHGGFLRYGSDKTREQKITASAHKISTGTKFVVRASENLTSTGEMQYGDAVWLETATEPSEVIGGRYGTAVHHNATMTPAMISSKRSNMVKARQYGRWIILNRENPISTIGTQVRSLDNIILEQEWYFLCSNQPNETTMYKMLDNSDEAMTTKLDLFRPKEECAWTLHLVGLPAKDKQSEKLLYKLLNDAQQNISNSQRSRHEKTQALLMSLEKKLAPECTESALMVEKLQHKRTIDANNNNLHTVFEGFKKNGFEKVRNPTKFLTHVYGSESKVTKMKMSILQKKGAEWQIENYKTSNKEKEHDTRSTKEREEEKYWAGAQNLLINTRVWDEMSIAMNVYYKIDFDKKEQAAMCIQRCARIFIQKLFNFKRKMQRVDASAKSILAEKIRARRELMAESATVPTDLPSGLTAGHASSSAKAAIINTISTVDDDFIGSPHGSPTPKKGKSMDSGGKFSRQGTAKCLGGMMRKSSTAKSLPGVFITDANDALDGASVDNAGGNGPSNDPTMGIAGNAAEIACSSATTQLNANSHMYLSIHTMVDSDGTPFQMKKKLDRRIGTAVPSTMTGATVTASLAAPFTTGSSEAVDTSFISANDVDVSVRRLITTPRHSAYNPNHPRNILSATLPHSTKGGRYSSPHQDLNIYRPKTANSVELANESSWMSTTAVDRTVSRSSTSADIERERLLRNYETKKQQELQKMRLSASDDNKFGLPEDVFENCQSKVSADTGIKFLRTLSAPNTDRNIYNDVQVVKNKKRRALTAHQMRLPV